MRYVLSDGAGAAVIENAPAASGISFRIDWVSLTSFANTEKTCRYGGSNSNSAMKSWLDYPTSAAAAADGALVLRQDLSLLPHLVSVGADEWERLCKLGKFDPDTLTWIPAHYSSERMKEIVFKDFARRSINAGRPEKWYSNLTSVGNIGSAAIFVKVAEAFTAPLEADGWRIRWIDVQPRVAFPFPWSIWQFFGVFRGNGQRLGLRMHVRAKCERDVGMA